MLTLFRAASTALIGFLLAAPAASPEAVVALERVTADRGARYDDPNQAAKSALVERINRERAEAGLSPVALDPLGSKVGDAFCRDAAKRHFTGHFDLEGRAPYLRWAEAGGVDWHAQNAASETRVGYDFREPLPSLLLATHQRFMDERPPDDGHRRLVLNATVTHVGIGFALEGREFRMTEEFSRRVADWVELPSGPVVAGITAPFALRVPIGWDVGAIQISFERAPRPMTADEASSRASYAYPAGYRTYRRRLADGLRWEDGDPGSFSVSKRNEIELRVPLDRGPGNYWVQVFAVEGDSGGRPLFPITGVLIKAE